MLIVLLDFIVSENIRCMHESISVSLATSVSSDATITADITNNLLIIVRFFVYVYSPYYIIPR